MKRLFIATDIQLSKNNLSLIHALKHATAFEKIVWVEQDLYHLTLRFLGATPDPMIEKIEHILAEETAKTAPFKLSMDKMGVFGSRYAPSVVWFGFNDFKLFLNLFERIEPKLTAIGIEENYGNFVPHITIGRIKNIRNKPSFWNLIERNAVLQSEELNINCIHLIQSKLSSNGPEYKILRSFEFQSMN